jgi:hypothetical protein
VPLVDPSIFQGGSGSGRAEFFFISGRENPAHDNLTGRVGPNFRAGLGRAARVFYSVKLLKTAFRAGLGPKNFFPADALLSPTVPGVVPVDVAVR